MRLKNKVIVVTGGNGLLGKAYINKITEDGGLAVNADINSGIDLSNFQHTLDITSEESIKLLIKNISC
jgi:NAD(P)-dependent dehydrogenase (short-subunit alcohol dehydrogenase family)